MKKRCLAFLLCAVMMLSCLPLTPMSGLFGMTASAADESVDISELRELYESVPDKSTWNRYVDSSILAIWYAEAQRILDDPYKYNQDYINMATASLQSAIAGLKYHTMGISLDQSTARVDVGDTLQLKAILNPENSSDPVDWKSSNENIASVTSNGLVRVKTYNKNGAVITASSNGHSATCRITPLNPLGGVKLSKSSHTLFETQSFSLTATAVGLDTGAATTDTVIYTWDSSNQSVASITDSGNKVTVNAINKGKTTISVTAKAGSNVYKASCTVTVNTMVPISGLKVNTKLDAGTLPLTVNETTKFNVTVSPSNASVKSFKWTSSDPKVATVTSAGSSGSIVSANIKALKAGKTKISYATTDGSNRSGSFTVEVRPLINFLSLPSTFKVISPDTKNAKLQATIKPSNAGNQVLVWTSSNADVCDVNYSGLLIPKSNGTAVITVKTQDGSKLSASCTVRVAAKATSVSLNASAKSMKINTTSTLTATVKTANGGKYNDVSWSSSNTKVATVSGKGKITAVYPGTATIKATALDGTGKTASCKVTVTAPVTGVSVTSKASMSVKQQLTLKPAFKPSYATNQKVTWSSSNTAVATVSAAGVVTAKKVGTATITCKTADGGYRANCVVSVVIKTTSIKVNKTSVTVDAGKTATVTATVAPSNATNKTVTWSTSNKNVATVSSKGVITGVAGGKCTITAKSSAGQTATVTVTVKQKVSGIKLNVQSASLYTTRVYTLKPTVSPSTATNKTVTWSSSNSKVASVSSSGVVTALKVGDAIITAKTADGGYTAKCSIRVFQKVNATGIKLSSSSLTIDKGKQTTIDAVISPSNASEKGVTWTTSDSSIATVNSSGVVKGIKTGKAVITAKAKDGNYTAKCTVTVRQKVTGIKLNVSKLKVASGLSANIKATVSPSDASNKKLTWRSSNTAVASVNSSGVVTGKKAGTATITATTADGGYNVSCTVTVYNAPAAIKLSANVLKIPKGESAFLTATITPITATNKTVTWSSSDKSVATVNTAGQITAVKTGATIITAKTKDGGLTADCMVEVVQLATSISINYTSVTIQAGSKKTISATIKPSTASNKTVKWSTSDKEVATVNSNGQITAVSAGTATITAKSGDGKVSAKCKVTVQQPVKSLKLNSTSMNVGIGKTKTLKATVSPSNATNKKLTWTTSDKSIATVNSSGVVKGIKLGTVTITATSSNGNVKATCKVRVVNAVTGVKLNKSSVTVNTGKSFTLVPTVSPSKATIKTVKWATSNSSVATVDSKGKVTTKKPGNAVITATTSDGGFKATCKVISHRPLKSIAFSSSTVTAGIGTKTKLSVKFSPSDASNKSITWKTSDKKIATIAPDGTLTPLKKGTVKITAVSAEGKYTATCTVKVVRKVTKVTLSKTSLVLYLGKTATLGATVAPSDASNKNVTWSSSNTAIVKVDSKGKLTPVKAGTATVTVKTADGGKTAKCTVKVETAVKTIKLSKTSLTLAAGKSATLTATLSPSNATNKSITWTSSNKSIATVDSKGVVKALKGGSVTITAKTSNGLTAKCTVKVTRSVTGVKLDKSEYTMYTGASVTLKATVSPSDATNKAVTWNSSDTKVATVSSSGAVKAIAPGTVTITAKTTDGGKTAKCVITVRQHVTSVELDKSELSLIAGEQAVLTATVLPKNATDKSISWATSNENVATVDADGKITAVAAGAADITVTSVDGKHKAVCTLTVIEPVTGVEIEPEKVIYTDSTAALAVKVLPAGASNKNVIWTSSNEECVTVSADGIATGHKVGTATVTVKTVDGEFTAECVVTVLKNAESITLTQTEMKLIEGENAELVVTVLPDDAQGRDIIWTSADEGVAKVENGVVTAVSKGSTVITATSATNEKVYASCSVEVLRAVKGVSLDRVTDTVYTGTADIKLTASIEPMDASNTDIVWSSSDESVAVVTQDGIVTPIASGTAIITVTTVDGGFTAEYTLVVRQLAQEVTFEKEQLELKVGESVKLNATVLPVDTTDKMLIWTSSDESVATVAPDGTVTALKEGEVTITATVALGGASASITVSVVSDEPEQPTQPEEPDPKPTDPVEPTE